MMHPRAVVSLILFHSVSNTIAFTFQPSRSNRRSSFSQRSKAGSGNIVVRSSSSSSSSSVTKEDTVTTSTDTGDILLDLCNENTNTKTKLTPETIAEFNIAIDKLADPIDDLDVNGNWRLVATISPDAEIGDNVDFFSIDSWKNYIEGSGPSPFQSLITGSSRVNGLSQWLTKDNFDNVSFCCVSLVGWLRFVVEHFDVVHCTAGMCVCINFCFSFLPNA